MEKSVIVDVANDQLRSLAVAGFNDGLVQLCDEILLKRFADWNRIEEELALVIRCLRTTPAIEAVAGGLRHIIAPFLVQTRQLFEFILESIVV